MAIKLEIATESTTRTIEALAYLYGYTETIIEKDEPIPNPESKEEFAIRMLQELVEHTIQDAEINLVMRQHEAIQKIETDLQREQAITNSKALTVTITK